MMIADCERWKLSTPEYHLLGSAKQHLLGKNLLKDNTEVNCHFNPCLLLKITHLLQMTTLLDSVLLVSLTICSVIAKMC